MLKVLIVGDLTSIHKFLKQGLEEHFPNIIIDIAITSKDAWYKIEKNVFDMIICEWKEPQIKGDELLKKVRENSQTTVTPFLMIVDPKAKDHMERAIKNGVSAFLVKPFSMEGLVQKIIAVTETFDRRKYARFDANGEATVTFGKKKLIGEIVDISLGGIMLVAERKKGIPAIFDEVKLELRIDKTYKLSGIKGTVLRIQAIDVLIGVGGIELAVKFDGISEKKEDELLKLISALKH